MNHTLCIDIGGTRIKSTVLPEFPSLEDLKTAPYFSIRTLGWLNYSFSTLVNPHYWPSIAAHYKNIGKKYDQISISVPGPVDIYGNFLRTDLTDGPAKVPKELKKAFEKEAGCRVKLTNDAHAWMLGFIRYTQLTNRDIAYPAMLLAFGTGIGVAIAPESNKVHDIEVSNGFYWKNVAERSGRSDILNDPGKVHEILGAPYFKWVAEANPAWTYEKIRTEFSDRVLAMIKDMNPKLQEHFGKIRTIILAGGNAEFVSIRKLKPTYACEAIPLIERELGFNPDRVSLLGVGAHYTK